jgi:HEPN domain-containing protein
MSHDPARVAETKSWFVKAASDLRAATHELTAVPPLTDDIVFHAQQAAEKAMKGYLSWHDQPFRRTHDLAEVGCLCTAIDATLEPLLRRAESLTVYAWAFRYPGDAEAPSVEESQAALAVAREVVDSFLARLPADIGA